MKFSETLILIAFALAILNSSSVLAQCDWGGPGFDTINGTVEWSPQQCPDGYHITGTVTVQPTGTLVILPGTEIYQHSSVNAIVVEGQIRARGTAAEPIQFSYPDEPTNNGNPPISFSVRMYLWDAVSCSLLYCDFINRSWGLNADIHDANSNIVVSHCRFINAWEGFRANVNVEGTTTPLHVSNCEFLYLDPWFEPTRNFWTALLIYHPRAVGGYLRYEVNNCLWYRDPDHWPTGIPYVLRGIELHAEEGDYCDHTDCVFAQCLIDPAWGNVTLLFDGVQGTQTTGSIPPYVVNNFLAGGAGQIGHLDRMRLTAVSQFHHNLLSSNGLNWPDDNIMYPDYPGELFFDDTYHFMFTEPGTRSRTGINGGQALFEGYVDPDGSLPDIGLYGGPLANRDSAYIVFPDQGGGDEIMDWDLERATYRVLEDYTLTSEGNIFVPEGTSFLCDEGVAITIDVPSNSNVTIGDADGDDVSFTGYDNALWAGIKITNPGVYTDIVANHLVISNAEIGVELRDKLAWGADWRFASCDIGLLLENSGLTISEPLEVVGNAGSEFDYGIVAIGGSWGEIQGGEIAGTDIGISAQLGSALSLNDVRIHHNHRGGISSSGSTISMHDCYVASNGNNIRTGAGILASHGSALLLRCNEINGNYGPGIYLHAGGTIAMHDFVGSANRGGNDISNNSFIGQIYTDCPSIKMPGGVNRIANSFAPSPLIVYRANEPDLPENQEIPVNGNNWGYTGTGHEQEIMDRLIPTGNFALENFEYEPNWSLCGEVIDPTFSECDSIWTQATLDMQLGEYEDAATLFKQIVKELPECSYAKPAAEQVSLAEKLAGTTLDDLRDTLLALRDETEDQALKFALAKRAAETSALDGNFITALSELDSLADGAPSSTDSVTALVSYACVTFLQAIMDSTDTLGTYTHFDTLQARLAALEAVLIDTSEHKPVVDHAPPTSVSAANDTFRVQANCYANAGEDIRDVVIDYRFWPTGEWERDTLLPTQVGSDSLWYLDIPLDSIGGGLTYRLVVIDSAWSFETWPVSDHGSGVYDTLTHFISFEPRVRRLQDTAHVYAPGVLTGDMRIDDGGVLQFLPSPLGGTDTVKIDSGVGISLEGSGGTLPVFSVTGTDNQAIVLTCEDPQDYWSGITAISGLADLRHCTIDRAEQPLYCNNLDARPIVVRMDSCEVNHFLLPLVISRTNAGQADSSYILHTTIQHGDSIGLWFGKEVSIDLADLTVQDCEDQGLWVALGNTLLLENCTVSGNGAAGLAWADEAINVQLSQCTFSLNGDSLPEIVASDQGVLELSNCILRDSTGVLLEADTVANLDLEFGSNYFQILDTATQNHTYISVADANPVCYLTGNYFSPEFVNDSTFVEDYLVPDELNSWIYTYLHLEHEQAEPVANPGDSLQLLAKSFLQNYVGSLSSDSISEVGFKYKVLPDQSTWTTRRVNEDRADSAYSWWVPVGNDGGLISYIFWSKDTHGRFLTSPLGADTTAPDSGNTHYLSFTLQDTVITQDSVVIYAPTTLTHTIQVDLGGRLVIKPWPGASDHTITLADGVSILVAPNAFGSRPKLWIEGTEDMPITFTNLTDSTEWDELRVYYGDATANYAIFEGAVSALQTYGDSPVIKFDHCTFDGAQSFLYWDGISSSSYMRNCVFTNLGEGTCGVLIGSTTMEITDCWFYNNRGFGLWGYDLGNSEISGCNFVSNDLGGVCSDGLVSSVSFSCNEFSFNGGDSTAEVFANGGAFDFSDGSGNVFADHAGSLLQGTAMTDFEIDGGENGFYLFDSTGFFIEIGDQTDTMNISGNYWYPFDPDTSIFWNHMDPDTSRYWRVDSIAPEVASCMQGQGFSLPEGGPTELVRPNMEGAGIASHHGSKGSAVATKQSSLRSLTAARKQAMTTNALYMQAKELQEAKDYANAAAAFEQFITANPNDPHIGAALSRHFVSAKAAGVAGSLLPFYQEQEKRLTSPGTRRIAHELSLEAMALSGDPQRALTGYEELMKTATNLHDSVRAVIATMYLSYRYGQDGKLRMRFPENRVSDFKDFAQRASKLSASLIHTPRAVNAEGASPAIPSAYRLHQNYPNPFNPVTEIRFDLPEAVRVELKVFNILGQEVATLMDAVRPAGAYHVQWDSRSTSGVTVGSGVYIYQLKAGNFVDSKKMVLIR